jgi:hypothetical protein
MFTCFIIWSRGSSVSIVYDYRPDDWGSIPDFSSSPCFQTGSGAHPASYTMGTGGKALQGRDADLSPHASPWRVAGSLYLTFMLYNLSDWEVFWSHTADKCDPRPLVQYSCTSAVWPVKVDGNGPILCWTQLLQHYLCKSHWKHESYNFYFK